MYNNICYRLCSSLVWGKKTEYDKQFLRTRRPRSYGTYSRDKPSKAYQTTDLVRSTPQRKIQRTTFFCDCYCCWSYLIIPSAFGLMFVYPINERRHHRSPLWQLNHSRRHRQYKSARVHLTGTKTRVVPWFRHWRSIANRPKVQVHTSGMA